MRKFDQLYHPTSGVDQLLRPLLEHLYASLTAVPIDLPALKSAILGVLEFLASRNGRTDANCRTVDSFLMQDEVWDPKELPESFIDILADMSGALHDTVSAPDMAANFESTPELLLARAQRL
jgi:hypothetical protein